jgi:hypothetical protein
MILDNINNYKNLKLPTIIIYCLRHFGQNKKFSFNFVTYNKFDSFFDLFSFEMNDQNIIFIKRS